MNETTVEKSVCGYIKRCGGKAYKFICPGHIGAPDRICIFPGGIVIFVELKRPGRKDGRSPQQIKFQNTLAGLGCNVMPHISSLQEFKNELKERFGICEL